MGDQNLKQFLLILELYLQTLLIFDSIMQKNKRRKKMDLQNRDFTCKCGKSYLSYVAAYTHVKNKHNFQTQFLDEIGKPERQKLPRGRPKQKKEEGHNNPQIDQLSIIEQTIMKIYSIVNKKFNKTILQGNIKQNNEPIQTIYNQLAKDKFHRNAQVSEQAQKFIKDTNKHFSAQISGRIKIVVVAISNAILSDGPVGQQQKSKIIGQLNQYDLWRGQNETNNILYQAFVKWIKIKS